MNWLSPYWLEIKLAAAILALCGALWGGYHYRDLSCQRDAAKAESAALKAVEAQRDAWQQRAYESDEALRKAQAAIPPSGQRVANEVRKHPTSPDCRVPDDVVRQLQDGIDAGKPGAR